MKKNEYFSLFADCIPVKGAKGSLIYDLTRRRYCPIPNLMYSILKKKYSLGELESFYSHKYDDGIRAYFDFLLEHDWGFISTEIDISNFPKIEQTFSHPFHLINITVEISNNESSLDNFRALMKDISDLRYDSLLIIYYGKADFKKIQDLLDQYPIKCFSYLEFIFENEPSLSDFNLASPNFEIKFTVLNSLLPKKGISNRITVEYKKDTIDEYCSCKRDSSFNINKQFFMESLLYNNCLNSKISVNLQGDIKSCLSSSRVFGNIRHNRITDIIENSELKSIWKVSKNMIRGCKCCEFRYMCLDCRVHIADTNDIFSPPLFCPIKKEKT